MKYIRYKKETLSTKDMPQCDNIIFARGTAVVGRGLMARPALQERVILFIVIDTLQACHPSSALPCRQRQALYAGRTDAEGMMVVNEPAGGLRPALLVGVPQEVTILLLTIVVGPRDAISTLRPARYDRSYAVRSENAGQQCAAK